MQLNLDSLVGSVSVFVCAMNCTGRASYTLPAYYFQEKISDLFGVVHASSLSRGMNVQDLLVPTQTTSYDNPREEQCMFCI